MKRLLILAVAVFTLGLAGCSSCGGSGLHCEKPCYGKNFQRSGRKMMDFVDVYLLNYDRHNPYRCDPCLGD